jgi:hypothetical protein
LGNAIKFLQPRHLLFDWFVQCQRIFGFETYAISIPSLPPGVVINDPENLEYVLKNESTITKGDFFRRRSWDLFGLCHSYLNSNLTLINFKAMALSTRMANYGRHSAKPG